jgi:hypothetical protein
MGYTSFLGDYDRDIDSDEEEIEFEEQFILRVPAGKPSEEMRELVRENGKGKDKGKGKGVEDVWFKFKGLFLPSTLVILERMRGRSSQFLCTFRSSRLPSSRLPSRQTALLCQAR